MAYYIKWNDDKTDYTVWSGASIGVKAMTEKGYERVTALPEKPEVFVDNTPRLELDAAYESFRNVCHAIGALIGDTNFRGGFDEMQVFETSAQSMTMDGIALAIKWVAANEACTYLASKLGIGQPDWWYECWKQVEIA